MCRDKWHARSLRGAGRSNAPGLPGELIGPYANGGREWRPARHPAKVKTHDVPDAELGKAIPYGIYDLAADRGWVSVGTDHDTAAFAVESLRRWWMAQGRSDYPGTPRLLITADAGGSNSYRTRAWKTELAAFAAQTGLEITVCHFPPGTSKWNAVEHRLFSHITMNWRGRPLTSHEVVVNTIAATATRTGLRVAAELDTASYPTGIKVSDDQLAQVPIIRHSWHGEWNYTVHPMPPQPAEDNDEVPQTPRRSPSRQWLRDPVLTGLTPTQWDELIEKLSVARHAQREAHLHTRRGGPRHAAAGTGRKAVLTLDDRTAITVLYQRFSPPQPTLAHLFGVTPQTISNVIRQTRTLLSVIGYTPEPTGTRLATPAELVSFAATAGVPLPKEIKSTCY